MVCGRSFPAFSGTTKTPCRHGRTFTNCSIFDDKTDGKSLGPRSGENPIPLTNRRLLHLDVVRGVAILLVLLYHTSFPVTRPSWYRPVNWVAASGWAGVDLFFVLSGFLIGGLLFRERERDGVIDATRFLIRRAFKTLPTYYAFLTTFAVSYVAFASKWGPTAGARWNDLARDLWPTVFHCQNYFPNTASKLGWLWSLAVEEHFYLLLALSLAWLTRRSNQNAGVEVRGFEWLFASVIILCPVARYFNSATFGSPSVASHLRFDSLFIGVALAYATRLYPRLLAPLIGWRWPLLAAGLSLFFLHRLLLSHPTEFPHALEQTVMAAGCAILVLVAFLWDKTLEERPNFRPVHLPVRMLLAWIGMRSYSIYVWHGWFSRPIAHRITQGTAIDPTREGVLGVVGELVFLLVPIALGALSFQLIENPFIRLRERWYGPKGPAPGASGHPSGAPAVR